MMRPRLLWIPLFLLLAACQSTRVERDYDPSRDFGAYRTWNWKEPALRYRPDDPRIQSDLTEQRLRQATGEELEQRGLRHAGEDATADLLVQAWLIVEDQQQQIITSYGGWGRPWQGYYWGGPAFWGGPGFVESRMEYRVGTLQIDLYDADDGRLVWRGSHDRALPSSSASPMQRSEAIRESVAEVLSAYPPR